jgi:hypothetical protein
MYLGILAATSPQTSNSSWASLCYCDYNNGLYSIIHSRKQDMKRVAVILLVLGMNLAHADVDKSSVPAQTKWKTECGSCHVPFPPHLLAAKDWGRLMGSLDKHFGANAALDHKDNKEILGYLLKNAGSGEQYSADSLRISDTPWFKHEHHVISAKEWTLADVNSRSNCSACHGQVVLGN